MTSSTNRATRWLVPLVAALLLSACSQEQVAPKKEPFNRLTDVVDDNHPTVTNADKFLRFVENVGNGTPDKIRVVNYTKEGDPVLDDLDFDGKLISYSHDDSRDKFGGGGSVQGLTCQPQIVKEDRDTETVYNLGGCPSKQTIYLLALPHEQIPNSTNQ